MAISIKAVDAFKLLKGLKKVRTYGKLIKESINEDTRPGGLMKLSIGTLLEIAGKALGTSLTMHPYYTFHKAHLQALAMALDASSNHDKALEFLNRAIRSADAARSLTNALADYQLRKNALKLTYAAIAGSLNMLQGQGSDPELAREMKEAGLTPESLRSWTDQSIYEWRARWCELFVDCVQLLAMVLVEARATVAAMVNYEAKMKAMANGGNLGRIAAFQMEETRRWEQFDRMTTPNSNDSRAVEDPVGFAYEQVATVEKMSDLLGECCESVMSDDAYRAATMALKLGSR